MLTENMYQNSINKNLQTLYYIEDPTTFSTYKTEKKWSSVDITRGDPKPAHMGKWGILRSPSMREILLLILIPIYEKKYTRRDMSTL